MNRKLAIIIGLQAFLIIVLFWVLVFYGKDEYEALSQDTEETIETPNRVSNKAGITIITVGAATQAQSGIQTTALKSSAHQASLSSYGNVISIDNLTELRSRYFAAKADAEVLRTTIAHNKIEYNRQYELNLDDKNVSDKVVATALATIKADEAKMSAAESNARNIADSIRQLWGETLAQQAISQSTNTLLQNLINAKEVLIQTTLPFESAEPRENSSITIAPIAAPSQSVKAYYLSRAPISNATLQGKTYFYHAVTSDLRAGIQVKTLSSLSKESVSGVIIPNSAVVWYGGKPWVYQKLKADQFSRLPINTETELENGWFYHGILKANDQIVTSGAQLLLSEEFKSQITNENED
jgi:hypothetical protein